jgi:toxin ParE1/3/4
LSDLPPSRHDSDRCHESSAQIWQSTICDTIAADNPSAALRWLDEIDKTLLLIAQHPLIGEAVDHLASGTRRYSVGNYLLFFKPIDNGIELRRVLHGARRIEDLF